MVTDPRFFGILEAAPSSKLGTRWLRWRTFLFWQVSLATRARTTRIPVGGYRSLDSAFRQNCAVSLVAPEMTSSFFRTKLPYRTANYGKRRLSQQLLRRHFLS